MEINDEKRREAASRMRGIMRRYPRCFLDNMVAQSVLDVMGDGVTIGGTVADLIDRPTCKNLAIKPADATVCACAAIAGCAVAMTVLVYAVKAVAWAVGITPA